MSLPNLKYLDLSGNCFKSLKSLKKLSGCPNLIQINLSKNQITDLHELEPLSHLSRIDLCHNKIKSLNLTHEVPNLRSVDLSYNQISNIDAIKNLPDLEVLGLFQNNITNFKISETLPRLEIVNIICNPIKSISGLESLPSIRKIEDISTLDLTEEEINKIVDNIERVDLELGWGDGEEDNEFLLTIYGPYPKKVFKVNNFITLKLRYDRHDNRFKTFLYVNGEIFDQCSFLLLQIPNDKKELSEEIDSIDEAAEKLGKSLEFPSESSFHIAPETEFWAHCSNIQAWVEHNYDTRLLHRNLAFSLLKKLTQVGDSTAEKIFKEEIAKRYSSGVHSVVEFLKKEGYLKFLSKDELSTLQN